MKVNYYTNQHNEILIHAADLSSKLDSKYVQKSYEKIQFLYNQFFDKLNIHFASQLKNIFPKLMNSEESHVSTIAKMFLDEESDLKIEINEFLKCWNEPNNLIEFPERFVREANNLLIKLKKRIDKEETILYPLLENE